MARLDQPLPRYRCKINDLDITVSGNNVLCRSNRFEECTLGDKCNVYFAHQSAQTKPLFREGPCLPINHSKLEEYHTCPGDETPNWITQRFTQKN